MSLSTRTWLNALEKGTPEPYIPQGVYVIKNAPGDDTVIIDNTNSYEPTIRMNPNSYITGLQSVAVDGISIIGDGTIEHPLYAPDIVGGIQSIDGTNGIVVQPNPDQQHLLISYQGGGSGINTTGTLLELQTCI
jgi:hypothetical protein